MQTIWASRDSKLAWKMQAAFWDFGTSWSQRCCMATGSCMRGQSFCCFFQTDPAKWVSKWTSPLDPTTQPGGSMRGAFWFLTLEMGIARTSTLPFDRGGLERLANGTKLDLASQCTSLGGQGMLPRKKWPMEVGLFRKKITNKWSCDCQNKECSCVCTRALITVYVQTSTVSWPVQYTVCRESRFRHEQTEQSLGRASQVPACSSSVTFKPKLLSRSLHFTATSEPILSDFVYTVFKHINTDDLQSLTLVIYNHWGRKIDVDREKI